MKCRICKRKDAQIELRAHNIALCKDDFITFFEKRVQRAIKDYRLFTQDEGIVVAVSGGKDSLALMFVLRRLGYRVAGVYVNLGIGDYSAESLEKCRQFSTAHGVPVYAFDVGAFFGSGIGDMAKRAKRSSCSLCGIIKRYVMNRFGVDSGYQVLATGHNLDDESAALMGNLINFDLGYLSKEKIILPAREKTLRKVKPLSLISEREAAAYALMNGIDYVYDECPHAVGATSLNYKNALNVIEEKSPGTKARFISRFMENSGIFRREDMLDDARLCANCGFLSYNEQCGFCNLASRNSALEKVRGDLLEYCTKL